MTVTSVLLGTGPRGLLASHSLLLSSFADRTWAYSFSGAVLFSMGFLVGLLCYLGYKYITKPPVPPNSLVSHPPGARGGPLGERPSKSQKTGESLSSAKMGHKADGADQGGLADARVCKEGMWRGSGTEHGCPVA